MTNSASCRIPLRVLGSVQLGDWARETSDRGGQDKSRKVRDGRSVGKRQPNSAMFRTLRRSHRNLRFSTTRYRPTTFDTLWSATMTGNDDFRIRPGRIRSTRAARDKIISGAGAPGRAEGRRSLTRPVRGAAASSGAAVRRALPRRGCSKAAPAAPWSRRGSCVDALARRLRAHIGYLQRDGVTRDGSPGKLFDAAGDDADGRAFAERCEGDRHHFRFIVSPDDAGELRACGALPAS